MIIENTFGKFYYKNDNNFNTKSDEICYISEYDTEQEIKDLLENNNGYTFHDIEELESTDIEFLWHIAEGQSLEVLSDDLDNM